MRSNERHKSGRGNRQGVGRISAFVVFVLGLASMIGLLAVASPIRPYSVICGDTTKPPNFDCVAFSGFAGQRVWGYPAGINGHNCTNYASYRLWQNGVINPGYLGDAKDWDNNAIAYRIPVNKTPAKGSIAVWEAFSGLAQDTGHVAYVDAVSGSGSNLVIKVSEDNYGGTTMRKTFRVGRTGWPDHFIHFKDMSQDSLIDKVPVRATTG